MDYASSAEPNPSSIHEAGSEAKKKLKKARKITAGILGAREEEIIFTSGGTESNNLAVQGAVLAFSKKMPHIVTTNIEHPSVLETADMLKKRKLAEVSVVPAEADGRIDPKKVKKAIKKNTVLVSVMYANNEIGTVEPIREIAKEIRHWRKREKSLLPYFHTDAVQAANYLDLNVERLGVDMMTVSGAKISGAGRIGVLFKRKSTPLSPVFGGGGQEHGLRPGTENLFEISKFAKALESARGRSKKEAKRIAGLRDYFLRGIAKSAKDILGKDVIVNGSIENRLPNNLNVTFPNMPSDLMVIELSERGVMVSEKSACKSGDKKASHVIRAIRKAEGNPPLVKRGGGLPSAHTAGAANMGSLRFSFGPGVKKGEVDYALKAVSEVLKKLKKWYN